WLSIRPGATAQPLASMTRSAFSVSAVFALPICVIRPSTATAVSASRIGWARSPESSRPMLRTTSLPFMGPAAASTAILAFPNCRRDNDHGEAVGEAQVALSSPVIPEAEHSEAVRDLPRGVQEVADCLCARTPDFRDAGPWVILSANAQIG